MARRGRPTVEITLGADERRTLQRWARRHSSSQALAFAAAGAPPLERPGEGLQFGSRLGCHATGDGVIDQGGGFVRITAMGKDLADLSHRPDAEGPRPLADIGETIYRTLGKASITP